MYYILSVYLRSSPLLPFFGFSTPEFNCKTWSVCSYTLYLVTASTVTLLSNSAAPKIWSSAFMLQTFLYIHYTLYVACNRREKSEEQKSWKNSTAQNLSPVSTLAPTLTRGRVSSWRNQAKTLAPAPPSPFLLVPATRVPTSLSLPSKLSQPRLRKVSSIYIFLKKHVIIRSLDFFLFLFYFLIQIFFGRFDTSGSMLHAWFPYFTTFNTLRFLWRSRSSRRNRGF